MSTTKNKRGQKVCEHCKTINGVRTYECKQCGHAFTMKRTRKGIRKKRVRDFTLLTKGDTIKVVGGSGPYYTDSKGDRLYLVERGRYTVSGTSHDGIHAYGPNGYNYLYMGTVCKSNILDTITRSPCKVYLLKTPKKPT